MEKYFLAYGGIQKKTNQKIAYSAVLAYLQYKLTSIRMKTIRIFATQTCLNCGSLLISTTAILLILLSGCWANVGNDGDNRDTAAAPAHGQRISYGEYSQLSTDWQNNWSQDSTGTVCIANMDTTYGGYIGVAEMQRIINSLTANNLDKVYFRFAKDPQNNKISVMFRGGQEGTDPNNLLIFRNAGEDFCPIMCDGLQ